MDNERFNFESLKVYQKALNFVNYAYDVTATFPRNERFILVEQFRRAAISIALNIAEGSTRECIAIISLSKMRQYIDSEAELDLRQRCGELSKMIAGLIKSLQ